MQTQVDPQRPAVPTDRDPDALRRIGALPPRRPPLSVPTKALHAPVPSSGRVLVHLDPGRMRAPGGAGTVYLYGPSRVDTYVGDLAVFGDGQYLPHLNLEFWNLPAGTDVIASVTARVGTPDHVLHLSATGNPLPLALTQAATGGQTVTVHVAAKVVGGWCTVVLEPGDEHQSFTWFGVDLRLL